MNGALVPTDRESYLKSSEAASNLNHTEHGGDGHSFILTEIPIARFAWLHVKIPFLIVFWIFVVGVCKLGM